MQHAGRSELIEQGEVFDRPYEEKQRNPADAEACEGMGPITVHANEHLAPSDKGVAMMRRRLRQQIREVAAGRQPMHVTDSAKGPVPTYGGDTVLTIPQLKDDESERLSRLAHAMMTAQFEVDGLREPERVKRVSAQLRQLNLTTLRNRSLDMSSSADRRIRVHIKNNHASPDTFPPTLEGEAVFTITQERFDIAARKHVDVAGHLDVVIDWDLDRFEESMRDAEVLVLGIFQRRILPRWHRISSGSISSERGRTLVPDGLVALWRNGSE